MQLLSFGKPKTTISAITKKMVTSPIVITKCQDLVWFNRYHLYIPHDQWIMKFNQLTQAERHVIENKATEAPDCGKYNKHFVDGLYVCKKCSAALYKSQHKFFSSCGWPSFDDCIKGAVVKQPDADGVRTEIVCSQCYAHLGHIFYGEHLTTKNIRHCVNSISLNFTDDKQEESFSDK